MAMQAKHPTYRVSLLAVTRSAASSGMSEGRWFCQTPVANFLPFVQRCGDYLARRKENTNELHLLLLISCQNMLGRKRTIIVGSSIMIVGAAIQCSAFSLPQLIASRLITGFGNGEIKARGSGDA